MKKFYRLFTIFLALICSFSIGVQAQVVYYVSNNGAWNNWDLYSYNIYDSVSSRLTFNQAIDNHPSISHYDTTMLVWSSTRDGQGEFNLFVADVTKDIDATATQITFNNTYPDRHPHWHPNRPIIIYTSKDRPVWFQKKITVVTECSVPFISSVDFIRYFEGMNVIDMDEPGTIIPLDIETAWDKTNFPNIWIEGDSTYVGHPSFNHQGDTIVFSAAIDGEGKNWEVYVAGFDPVNKTLKPNSLRRVTHGPDDGANPIKMSGGATFSYDDNEIIFNSTRITGGNSQIFSVPSNSVDIELTDSYRKTWHNGNDYVPEAIDNDRIIITSDLGVGPICNCGIDTSATDDLDVVLLTNWSNNNRAEIQRTVIGNESFQETQLIADEVSWFCGLPPNLTSCTFLPRIMSVESLWLEFHSYDLLDPDLLIGYDPMYEGMAQEMYDIAAGNLENYLLDVYPDLMYQIYEEITFLDEAFPGWEDTTAFSYWYNSTEQVRTMKHVVPAIMYGIGLGDSCVIPGINEFITSKHFRLNHISPNPFTQITTINYDLEESGHVELKVLDILGNEITTLIDEIQPTGTHNVQFNSGELPSGIYFCALSVNQDYQFKKMILLKY